jgi:pSer/pThr/pTyr-binding forkhead associated (FHA) protein
MVRDLGSANGTWVNGVRVSKAPLVDGDVLSIGGEQYRVSVAMGETASSTTSTLRAEEVAAARAGETAQPETPRFSSDWKQRVEGIEKAAPADKALADDTSRGATATDETIHPSLPSAATASDLQAAQPLGAPGARVRVQLSGEGVELAVTGGGSYVIGSDASAALRVAHPSVSPAHARLIVSDILGSAFLQAEDPATLKNGEKVEKTEPLHDGDLVRLGDVELVIALRRVD